MKTLRKKEYDEIKYLISSFGNFEPVLKKCSKFLGRGSSRKAWLIKLWGYEPFVLKTAMINGEWDKKHPYYGLRQNKNEVNAYRRSNHKYIPNVYDWDEKNFTWVEMEYLKRISKSSYHKLYGDIKEFSRETGVSLMECFRIEHWGKNSEGKIKFLDLGA